jgi:hypothetical protein
MPIVTVENQEIDLKIFSEQVKKIKIEAAKLLEKLIIELDFNISLQIDYFYDDSTVVLTKYGSLEIDYIAEGKVIGVTDTIQECKVKIIDLDILDIVCLCEMVSQKSWQYLFEE